MRHKQLEKMGATPGKLALIGVLSLVLVLVIVKQLPTNNAKNLNTSVTTTTSQQPPTTQISTTKSKQQRVLPPWPEVGLNKTLASDPFTPPAWAVQKERAAKVTDNPGALAELQKQGASIVVIAAERKSATVGEQKVRIGDVLEGYQVTDITTQGILLDKFDSR